MPLSGLRIIEFGNFIAGPFAGMLLADMGADVIKVEPPNGDMARATPPIVNGESGSFMMLNRNKRSIVLDLKHLEGRLAAAALIEGADAVIENFRPGVMDSLGLGAEAMRARKPGLVYVSVSGFGQTGPDRHRAAVNLIIEAASGTLSVTGEPGGMPVRPGLQTGDILGAMFATYGVLSGLLGAARQKKGRTIDVSLIEGSVAASFWEVAEYLNTGQVPRALGNRHRMTAPYQLFETRDGRHIAIGAPNDGVFRRVVGVLGLQDLATDPRFKTYVLRKVNEEPLCAAVADAVRERDAAPLERALLDDGVPASIVRTYEDVFKDPHFIERGLIVEAAHPKTGVQRTVRNPVGLDEGGPGAPRPSPLLGQHTQEILREAGYDDCRIAALRAAGAIEFARGATE